MFFTDQCEPSSARFLDQPIPSGARGTFAWADPEADVSCVALTDRDFGDWALQAWSKLADLVLTNGVCVPTELVCPPSTPP